MLLTRQGKLLLRHQDTRGEHVMNHEVVFLIDVDNTLLDADQVTFDLGHFLEETRRAQQQRYWNLFKTTTG